MKATKHFHCLVVATLAFQTVVLGSRLPLLGRRTSIASSMHDGKGCPFTITSSGSLQGPAGQLEDGQIRLNGSYKVATFYLGKGGIVDSSGFGCIVTPSPITQIQCDQSVPPDPELKIDGKGSLVYKGSNKFFACPATDIEHNIYASPDFGQGKCVPIGLSASDCGAPPPPPPPLSTTVCPPKGTTTVWKTEMGTHTSVMTVTVSALVSNMTCPPPLTTKPCRSCGGGHSTAQTETRTASTFGL